MRAIEITFFLVLSTGLLIAGPGCPADDDDAADDDSADDDTADDDTADDDTTGDDDTGFCEQPGPTLADVLEPQMEEACPFPLFDDLATAEAACAEPLGSPVVDFEVLIAGDPHVFEPTQVCAVSPVTLQDQALTTSFTGFALVFATDDFEEYLLIWVLDTTATPEDVWVTLTDPLCPTTSSWERTRFLTYARLNGTCFIPGFTGEAGAWFDLHDQGSPDAGDFYVAEYCAVLPQWDYTGPKAKITGDFQAQIGKTAVMSTVVELPELCP